LNEGVKVHEVWRRLCQPPDKALGTSASTKT
jgi:hypothetical protein